MGVLVYFQEWPSGLEVPGCSVEMGGRAGSIDNTPGNILSPQAPSQNVAPQVPLVVNTCPPQAQINILSPGQSSSVLSSPSVESISPVAPPLVPGVPLHSPPNLQSPPLHSPVEAMHGASLPLQSPPTAALGYSPHSTPVSPVPHDNTIAEQPRNPFALDPHKDAILEQPRNPFAFGRRLTDPIPETIFGQSRVIQNQTLRRASTGQPSFTASSGSLSPGTSPLNLALPPLCLTPSLSRSQDILGSLVVKSEIQSDPCAYGGTPKTVTAPSPKKVKGEIKGDQTLNQVIKSESYVALYCTLCNKMFTSQSGLQRHINTAHKDPKDKPFKCQDCGKGFLSERTLKTHTNMHLGVYPYHCQYCNKGFPNQDNLKGHLASHTNVKEFKCDQCGQEFTYRTSLNQHIAKAHQP